MTIDQALDGGTASGGSRLLRRKRTRPAEPGPQAQAYAVEQLWYMLLLRPWSSLAVVSPEPTPNTPRLARSLAEFGTQPRRRPVEVIDGLQLDMERAATIVHRIEPRVDPPRLADPRLIIALDSPIANPIAIEVLTACDAAVMLLEKGITTIPQARKIIHMVGRQRLIGAVLAVD